MFRALQSRRVAIAIIVLMAVAAVIVPTARVVGCSLSGLGGAMPWGGSDVLGFFADCGAELVVAAAPVSGSASASSFAVLAFVALLFMAVLRETPRVQIETRLAHSSDPPPAPPEDSLGTRLSL